MSEPAGTAAAIVAAAQRIRSTATAPPSWPGTR